MRIVLTATLVFVLGLAGFANAEVMTGLVRYQLKADAAQAAGVEVVNDYLVQVLPGTSPVIKLSLYATLTNNGTAVDPATSGVRAIPVSMVSTGPIRGTLLGTVIAPFTGTGVSNGASADLDADGDLDIGAGQAGMIYPKPTTWMYGTSGTAYSHLVSTKIADVTFAVTDVGQGAPTLLDVIPYATSSTLAGGSLNQFQINATNYALGNKTTSPQFNSSVLNAVGLYTDGCTVQVVPEPSTLILLGMGALALLVIRRRK